MKKILILIFVCFVATVIQAQDLTMKAFFTGYDEEEGFYTFEDPEGNYMEFVEVKAEVLKKFNLKGRELLQKSFEITYIIEEMEVGDYFENRGIILKLKPIELERNIYDEELDEEEDIEEG